MQRFKASWKVNNGKVCPSSFMALKPAELAGGSERAWFSSSLFPAPHKMMSAETFSMMATKTIAGCLFGIVVHLVNGKPMLKFHPGDRKDRSFLIS